MEIVYFSTLLIAIAFTIVVIYIALLLHRISGVINTLGSTLGEVEKELDNITPQLRQAVKETEIMVDDMEDKLKSTDSFFDTAENVGTSINTLNSTYSNQKLSTEQFEKKIQPFVEGITWSEAAFQLYSKWKQKTPDKKNELMIRNKETNIVPLNQTGKEG
ncbi:DUF948 domain-containing protein [Virgibacillus sp. C22-A2]|uniref:DUF948 domain-containing protein n=1 Tax=Virgibacillus tibetensis TaxID=3042313 RepID=A0ABU6KL13_9BACI|nr:DUF948 domain-containing protein [Virgibacillus sp. C22-A2]